MKLPFKPNIVTKGSYYGRRQFSKRQLAAAHAQIGRSYAAMRPALNKINNSALMNKMNQKNAPYIGAALGATVVGTSAAVIGLKGKSSGGTGQVTSQNTPMY